MMYLDTKICLDTFVLRQVLVAEESIKFYHLYIDHVKCRFFLEQLCGHVQHGEVHKTQNILFGIFRYVKNIFQIKGAYAPERKKYACISPHFSWPMQK
jgi:hypothetical protein